MRRSTSLSVALALKGILTDVDADGSPDCDRHGNVVTHTPEWLPAGATRFYDFENGQYYANSAEVALADILTETIQVSSGALRLSPSDLPAHLVGGFNTDLMNGTVVVDCEEVDTDSGYIVAAVDGSDSNEFAVYVTSLRPHADAYSSGGGNLVCGFLTHFGPGRGKLAATFTNTAIALSFNGSAINRDDRETLISPVTTLALIGGYDEGSAVGGSGLVVYSITVYPPQADAGLPALSA